MPSDPNKIWQRIAVGFALLCTALLIAASQVGCGGSPDDEPADARAAIPAAPSASQAI